jgi:hypothetical protein
MAMSVIVSLSRCMYMVQLLYLHVCSSVLVMPLTGRPPLIAP